MTDTIYQNYILFLLVFARFSGAFFLNPMLSRKSVPVQIKAGLAFLCALLITGTLDHCNVTIDGWLTFTALCAKELAVGFISGFMINLVFSAIIIAGELIDLQLGVSMSKIYDPQSNVSMPVSATLLNLMLTLTFFITNGHLTLIRILTLTFRILPPGTALLGTDAARYLVLLFGQILAMGLKIAMPVIAVELLAEFGMGVLMRTAPQINVFSVGLQLRIMVGLLLVLLLVPSFAHVMDQLIAYMFEKMEYAFRLMA